MSELQATLQQAVAFGNADGVRDALDAGADPNDHFLVYDDDGSPLAHALHAANVAVVRLLLVRGASGQGAPLIVHPPVEEDEDGILLELPSITSERFLRRAACNAMLRLGTAEPAALEATLQAELGAVLGLPFGQLYASAVTDVAARRCTDAFRELIATRGCSGLDACILAFEGAPAGLELCAFAAMTMRDEESYRKQFVANYELAQSELNANVFGTPSKDREEKDDDEAAEEPDFEANASARIAYDDDGYCVDHVVVFGAAGQIGRAIVENLVAAGHRVRCFERSEDAWLSWVGTYGDGTPPDGVDEHVYGDIVDFEAVSDAVRGADAVIHSAVYFPPSVNQLMPDYQLPSSIITAEDRLTAPPDTTDEKIWLINLKGLYNVLQAAQLHGCRRVVHIGSASAEHPSGEFFDAGTRRPDGSLYAITKRLQEEMCRQHAEAHGTRVVVLRPDYVVDAALGIGRFCEPLPGNICGADGWVDRADLADAARLALQKGADLEVLHCVTATAPGRRAAELVCNVSRTKEVLGWAPTAQLERFRPDEGWGVRADPRDIDEAVQVAWEYLRLKSDLSEFEAEPADAIICLGSSDLNVAAHAAELFKRGLGKKLVCSGGVGTGMHSGANMLGWDKPEAEVFAEECERCGVPKAKILREEQSTNSGENMRFSHAVLLEDAETESTQRIILVQKPFMTRRAYATFKKQWLNPSGGELRIAASSEDVSFDAYMAAVDRSLADAEGEITRSDVISIMTGDLQRITLYAQPPTEFQIEQYVPPHVAAAQKLLIDAGYTSNLIFQ